MISTNSGFFVCLHSSPVLQRNHRQYQSASYHQPYNNQYRQPNNYQYQQYNDICDGQDKFFNPLSVYDMGQNILNGLLGPSSGGAGFGGVTVNTHFQNFGNFNGNFNSGVINAHSGGQVGGIGSPTSNSRFQNFGTFNGNANTGMMNGGSQRINYGGVQSGGFGNQATNGGNQAINMIGTQNKIDIEALLAALMRVFEKKSFGGQEQYINKQTGYTADCNEMKTFLQREMNSQNNNYYPYQNNYSNSG